MLLCDLCELLFQNDGTGRFIGTEGREGRKDGREVRPRDWRRPRLRFGLAPACRRTATQQGEQPADRGVGGDAETWRKGQNSAGGRPLRRAALVPDDQVLAILNLRDRARVIAAAAPLALAHDFRTDRAAGSHARFQEIDQVLREQADIRPGRLLDNDSSLKLGWWGDAERSTGWKRFDSSGRER